MGCYWNQLNKRKNEDHGTELWQHHTRNKKAKLDRFPNQEKMENQDLRGDNYII